MVVRTSSLLAMLAFSMAAAAANLHSQTSLEVATSSEHGVYLTDANGRALYTLESKPLAGDKRLERSKLGMVKRADGSMQVTYNEFPLYYYSGDRKPGQTKGEKMHDRWGSWYLVSPAGEEIRK